MRRLRFWGHALQEGARWLYGVLNPVLFVLTLLALVAVVVGVGVKGPLWLSALLLALIVVGAFAEGTYRLWLDADRKVRRQRSRELADEWLYRLCTLTATGLQVFITERVNTTPTLTPVEQVELAEGTLPKAKEIEHKMAVFRHEQETQSQYREKFAAHVFTVVADLRQRGYIPEADLEWLNFPTDLAGIARVGDRLLEITPRVLPEHWRK